MNTEAELLGQLCPYPSNAAHLRLLTKQICSNGGLTPYVGAGMSTGSGFPTWTAFLQSMAGDPLTLAQIDLLLGRGDYEEAASYIEKFAAG